MISYYIKITPKMATHIQKVAHGYITASAAVSGCFALSLSMSKVRYHSPESHVSSFVGSDLDPPRIKSGFEGLKMLDIQLPREM